MVQGVWALRTWALQPLKNNFHDEHEYSKHISPSFWHAPELEAPRQTQSIPADTCALLTTLRCVYSDTQQVTCGLIRGAVTLHCMTAASA